MRVGRLCLGTLILSWAAVYSVSAQNHKKPLSKSEVIHLLERHTPPAQLEKSVNEDRISFVVTTAVQQEFRKEGATPRLLNALRAAQPRGLIWGRVERALVSEHGLLDVTPLAVEGTYDYLAFNGDDHHLRLASDAAGSWKIYDIAPAIGVSSGANVSALGLAVRSGVAYIPFVAVNGDRMQLFIACNPSRNLDGPWLHVPVYTTDSSYLQDPSATIAGDSLVVAFDDVGAKKGSNDVFVATMSLSGLATGATSSHVTNVTKVDDVQGGPADDHPVIVADGDRLNLAWQHGLKSLVYTQGNMGGNFGTAWPSNPRLLHTATDQADQSLQLAAGSDTVLATRFVGDPDRNDSLGCCDVWATIYGINGGSPSTQSIGRTELAIQKPGVAVGECGPSVAYNRALSANSGRLTVATFEDGHWFNQSLAMNANNPRLAATPTGLEMSYVAGYGDLMLQSAKCFPPPAPLQP